jgi:hypothetical protein
MRSITDLPELRADASWPVYQNKSTLVMYESIVAAISGHLPNMIQIIWHQRIPKWRGQGFGDVYIST